MNNNQEKWQFVPIEKRYQKNDFDCGYESLNIYLQKYARQNDIKGIAKTFVALSSQTNDLKIRGYYTISASIIEFNFLPENYQKKLPNYPIPTLLIGKLAVDNKSKGQGLGTELLINALKKAIKLSKEMGIFAVRVDAIDLQAKNFYLNHEFIPFKEQELSLFLPISILENLFDI